MKYFLFCLFCNLLLAQNNLAEIPPKFESCNASDPANLKACFLEEIQAHLYKEFKDTLNQAQQIHVKFLVTKQGNIQPYFIQASQQAHKTELQRVFGLFPNIQPATFRGNPIEQYFTINLTMPLQALNPPQIVEPTQPIAHKNFDQPLSELEDLISHPFDNPIYNSQLDVPFSHQNYAVFEPWLQKVGANNHTASKPYNYQEVNKYFDLKTYQENLHKKTNTWLGKKWWNQNMLQIQGDGYWFTLDPIADLRLGRDFGGNIPNTFINTRGLRIQGGLGSKLHFHTTIYETQAQFAQYYDQFTRSIAPSGGNPGIIPGIGIAKEFGDNSFDFPLADAVITYTPSHFINLQLGYQRNFIGDGYRSMLLGDAASPYPFLKINTTFWKIKYTNLYTWLKDVRPEVTLDRTYATKFMSAHYLSWNVSNRLNVGLFESVVWGNDNNRGFDASFWNPIVFYRSVEFNASSRSGNALIGLTGKYKWHNRFHFYGQLLIDEFSFGDVTAGNNSWKNKFAHQIGAKYFEPFNLENLTLQLEYNTVRPYVYSHSAGLTNYGHNNQSLGHPWGANLRELILIGRYFKDRWFAEGRLHLGTQGFDFNTDTNNFNYGANIYLSYDDNRPFDDQVLIGQGNKTNLVLADLQLGYVINPATNLKVFANLIYRSSMPQTETPQNFNSQTTWFNLGFRTDLFNWYFDY